MRKCIKIVREDMSEIYAIEHNDPDFKQDIAYHAL